MSIHRRSLHTALADLSRGPSSIGPRHLRDRPDLISHRVGAQVAARLHAERGDVPGWVLITLMTAGIVLALWGVAGPQLTSMFTEAMEKFSGKVG